MTTTLGQRAKTLADLILKYKLAYYRGKPLVSDAEFDGLEDELRRIDPQHPALQTVGAPVPDEAKKVPHERPMLSLQKVYAQEELLKWVGQHPVVGTIKIDGNSLSLVYRKGVLTMAKTRGDGRMGEDVTDRVFWICDAVPRLTQEIDIEVRGELYCSLDEFEHLEQEMLRLGLEPPNNPRNIVAGILGRKSHAELAKYFHFIAFDAFSDDTELFQTETAKLEFLVDQGFKDPEWQLLKDHQQVTAFLGVVEEKLDNHSISIDGAVFSYDDLNLHRQLGETSHHPKYKMSFKWQGATAITTIREIRWSTSRLGIVTPVALVEPTPLSGATITNVTLHNADNVIQNDLKAGDAIEIVRSGEVIPKYLRTAKKGSGSRELPSHCPSCQTELEFDGVRLRCPNLRTCPAQRLGVIANWVKCCNIDDLSDKRLMAMMEHHLIRSIPDLYRLTEEQLLQLPGTKEKLAKKHIRNIDQSRSQPLANCLNGLGISGMGLTSWERILSHYPSIEEVLSLSSEDLLQLDGFAEKTVSQVIHGLAFHKPMITELRSLGVQFPPHTPQPRTNQQQLQFVITGSLSQPRSYFEDRIKEKGHLAKGSVTKKTHALITDDPSGDSSKLKKARDLHIPIWSETQLTGFLEGTD